MHILSRNRNSTIVKLTDNIGTADIFVITGLHYYFLLLFSAFYTFDNEAGVRGSGNSEDKRVKIG